MSASNKPAPKFKRSFVACTNCRARKVKCGTPAEGEYNPCARCVKKGLKCEYAEEGLLASASQTPTPSTSSAHVRQYEPQAQQPHPAPYGSAPSHRGGTPRPRPVPPSQSSPGYMHHAYQSHYPPRAQHQQQYGSYPQSHMQPPAPYHTDGSSPYSGVNPNLGSYHPDQSQNQNPSSGYYQQGQWAGTGHGGYVENPNAAAVQCICPPGTIQCYCGARFY